VIYVSVTVTVLHLLALTSSRTTELILFVLSEGIIETQPAMMVALTNAQATRTVSKFLLESFSL
jgi:hypothetical protein